MKLLLLNKRGCLCVMAGVWFCFAPVAQAGTLELASRSSQGVPANAASSQPAISADGRFVAFTSDADNLVANDPSSSYWGADPDVFLLDRQTGLTELVSGDINSNGLWFLRTVCRNPAVDAAGRLLAFECFSGYHFAHNMKYDIYLYDRDSRKTERVNRTFDGRVPNGGSEDAVLSAGGRFVAYSSRAANLVAGDINGVSDVFVFDRISGLTERVSMAADGAQGNGGSQTPALSADGRFVAFASAANNLVPGDINGFMDIFVRDRQTGLVERIGGTGGDSTTPALSADGRFVAFASPAFDLVPGDTNGVTDIFVYDRQTGAIEQVSVGDGGMQAASACVEPVISAEGRYVTFTSAAGNLVADDGNALTDVFVHDRQARATVRVSLGPDGQEASAASSTPVLSADGRHAAFVSTADNLVVDDGNRCGDVFVHTSTVDITPPTVSIAATPNLLWPPNKKYVNVLIAGTAEDETGEVSVEIAVTDEYGEMIDMAVPGFGSTVALESWREGDDRDGRIYTVTATATDAAGNSSVTTTQVVVPHDLRGKNRE